MSSSSALSNGVVASRATSASKVTLPPQANLWNKVQEGARLALVWHRITMQNLGSDSLPVSKPGKLNHRYVWPLSNYHGKNERVIMQHEACRAIVRDSTGFEQHVIQCSSHNYAGLYGLDLDLHHLALEKLPVTLSPSTRSLEDAMHRAVTDLLGVDFCVSTSTGYGSNILALSAILDEN